MSAQLMPICAICGKPIRPLEGTAYAWIADVPFWALVHRACKGDASPCPAFVWPAPLRPLPLAEAAELCYA
jgi:hypothetical protein